MDGVLDKMMAESSSIPPHRQPFLQPPSFVFFVTNLQSGPLLREKLLSMSPFRSLKRHINCNHDVTVPPILLEISLSSKLLLPTDIIRINDEVYSILWIITRELYGAYLTAAAGFRHPQVKR